MGIEQHNPWRTLTQKTVYENKWIQVEHRDVITPTGTNGIYGTVHFKNIAIGVVPLDADGNTWLVGQFRYAIGEYSWEMPEGGCPEGEDFLEAAQRELKEETGIDAVHWQQIMKIHTSNSVTDEVGYVYVAWGLSFGEAEPDETEELHLRKMPLSEVVDLIIAGEITDAFTIAGILKVHWLLQNDKFKLG